MRLFVALSIAEEIKDSLENAVDKLREARAPVRWVKHDGLHLTLKFLGETTEDKLNDLTESLKAVSGKVYPFDIVVEGMGAFPHPSRPRVVWVSVEEQTGTLSRLHRLVEEAVVSLGWAKEKRKFSPHVTLGRVKGNINLGKLEKEIGTMSDTLWGKQSVDNLVIYRSFLGPGGARYEVIRDFPLGQKTS